MTDLDKKLATIPLRDAIAQVIADHMFARDDTPTAIANAVIVVVQPAIDAERAKVERLKKALRSIARIKMDDVAIMAVRIAEAASKGE